MRLKQPFLKLPIRFDADALAAEVRALPAAAWVPHPGHIPGNEAVRLITPNGTPTDALAGPMAATEHLKSCEYVQQIMAEVGGVWGRSRFMGLAAGAAVPLHIDINYYWRTHLRIHIPVITNPDVLFTCGDETIHMAPGECWIFDSFRWHEVHNKGSEQRVHLVLDTVGGGLLPQLMKDAEADTAQPRRFAPGSGKGKGLLFERVNSPKVMSPWEIRCHIAFIREHAGADPKVLAVLDRVEEFVDEWAAVWSRFGAEDGGYRSYSRLLLNVRAAVDRLGVSRLELPNYVQLQRLLDELIFEVALAPEGTSTAPAIATETEEKLGGPNSFQRRFDRPIFVVSTPRSGSTLLYETLEQAPDLYSGGNESHWLIENIPGLSPQSRGWSSNRLTAEDAKPEPSEQLAEAFYRNLKDRDGRLPEGRVRMLEKTPKNALRVSFFDAIWPDAHFIYLYRDVRETLYSMMEAWHSGGFRTYPQLPGWRGAPWSMLLVPGWQRLNGLKIPHVAAHQWAITTETLLDDLERLDPARVEVADYHAFLSSPQAEIERIAKGVGLSWDRQLVQSLPLSKTTLSRPQPEKWRRIEPVIQAVWPIVERADRRAREFVERRHLPAEEKVVGSLTVG